MQAQAAVRRIQIQANVGGDTQVTNENTGRQGSVHNAVERETLAAGQGGNGARNPHEKTIWRLGLAP